MTESTFTPQGDPLPLNHLAEYVEDGGAVVRRGDVERAIATAEDELKMYLEAPQYRQRKK